jgi:hypothetical protein
MLLAPLSTDQRTPFSGTPQTPSKFSIRAVTSTSISTGLRQPSTAFCPRFQCPGCMRILLLLKPVCDPDVWVVSPGLLCQSSQLAARTANEGKAW